ncbi:MAG: hypothetical protein Q8L68_02710 [Methylococcales bacterium]|nr:hypothetical protein [Methylococcales bacterium]
MNSKTIHIKKDEGIRVFIDLNETLIRTGEVALINRLIEENELEEFIKLCELLSDEVDAFELGVFQMS